MKELNYDIVVIGGGCAGMAAALSAKKHGAERILILERSAALGGVLRQCIHNGFGIHRFREDLTGTEYAARFTGMIGESGIEVFTKTAVLGVGKDRTVTAMNEDGLMQIEAGALIIATGCRERPRGALNIPGSRPAGIMTAGCAQRYLNLEGYLVGKKIVILGSGDIGLIMARQFTLEGAEVCAVAELQPYSSGLTRNIVQCIEDFGIPLYYNTTVSRIEGEGRLTGVWLTEVGEKREPLSGTERFIECDSLILSVGLIPENELIYEAGISMDRVTGGAVVDDRFQTDAPGIFSCGNALHVHDLVDYVTQESEEAGKNAALYVREKLSDESSAVEAYAGDGVRGLVPQRIYAGSGKVRFQFRPADRYRNCRIVVCSGEEAVAGKTCSVLTPGEMCSIEVERSRIRPDRKLKVQVKDYEKRTDLH